MKCEAISSALFFRPPASNWPRQCGNFITTRYVQLRKLGSPNYMQMNFVRDFLVETFRPEGLYDKHFKHRQLYVCERSSTHGKVRSLGH